MTPSDLVRRWYEEVWNQGRLDVCDELFTPNYRHPGQPLPGPIGPKRVVDSYRRAFPDIRFTIEDMIADGPRVASRLTFRGTHLGVLDDLAPTGRTVEVRAIGIFHVEGDRLAKHWGLFDENALRRQLEEPQADPAPWG
jgi:predicted ester cyclase